MKTLLTVEKNIRRVVFKSLWKALDVRSLSDAGMLAVYVGVLCAAVYAVCKAL